MKKYSKLLMVKLNAIKLYCKKKFYIDSFELNKNVEKIEYFQNYRLKGWVEVFENQLVLLMVKSRGKTVFLELNCYRYDVVKYFKEKGVDDTQEKCGFDYHFDISSCADIGFMVNGVEFWVYRLNTTIQTDFDKSLQNREEFEKNLIVSENTINHLFWQSSNDFIIDAIKRAAIFSCGDLAGGVNKKYIKKARSRFCENTGLSAFQNFILELDCLSRINEAMQICGVTKHFPLIMDFNIDDLTITMSHTGCSLKSLSSDIKVKSYEIQIDIILNILDIANVLHLDMHPNGKNITVNNDGVLSIIDFDIAISGGYILSPIFADRIDRRTGLVTKEVLLGVVKNNCNLLLC